MAVSCHYCILLSSVKVADVGGQMPGNTSATHYRTVPVPALAQHIADAHRGRGHVAVHPAVSQVHKACPTVFLPLIGNPCTRRRNTKVVPVPSHTVTSTGFTVTTGKVLTVRVPAAFIAGHVPVITARYW